MITCPNCHQELPDDAKFCGNCATSIQGGTPVASSDTFVGKSINNKYLVQKRIASGGMGEVYLAIQKGVGQEVAIKKLHPEYYRDGEIVKRFIDEARSYGKITHPNAVKLHDLLNVNGQLCIIMEFVHGKTLTQFVESGYVFSIRQILDISLQLADALGTVHRAGIIHRDLKTENVMLMETVTGRFSVKILDFGIAKFMDRPNDRTTKEGVIVGTPEFMSPEQCYGLTVDHRADIYAFGILMYVMICNKLPFVAESSFAVLKLQTDAPVPPCERLDHSAVPADLEAIVQKCLQKYPQDRYQSFEDVITDLTAVQEGGHPSIATLLSTVKADAADELTKTADQEVPKEAEIQADQERVGGLDDTEDSQAIDDEEKTSVDEDAEDAEDAGNTPQKSMPFLGEIDFSEEHASEPEFSIDDEEEGDGLILGSIADLPAVETQKSRSHGGTIAAVVIVVLIVGALGFVLAARSGVVDLSQSGAPQWLLPEASRMETSTETPEKPPVQIVENTPVVETPQAIPTQDEKQPAPEPEPPKAPDPIPASTAITQQVLMSGILLATMDKVRPLVNDGELDAADALIAYMDAHKANLDESSAASFKEISDRCTQFREILKTANKTKNGARDGRSCDPISALAKDIPEEAAGMVEKIEKLKQTCQHNLSVVPDTL